MTNDIDEPKGIESETDRHRVMSGEWRVTRPVGVAYVTSAVLMPGVLMPDGHEVMSRHEDAESAYESAVRRLRVAIVADCSDGGVMWERMYTAIAAARRDVLAAP